MTVVEKRLRTHTTGYFWKEARMKTVGDMKETAEIRRELAIRAETSRVPMSERDLVCGLRQLEAQLWMVGAEICERLDRIIEREETL